LLTALFFDVSGVGWANDEPKLRKALPYIFESLSLSVDEFKQVAEAKDPEEISFFFKRTTTKVQFKKLESI
jgi:hypothetical protein